MQAPSLQSLANGAAAMRKKKKGSLDPLPACLLDSQCSDKTSLLLEELVDVRGYTLQVIPCRVNRSHQVQRQMPALYLINLAQLCVARVRLSGVVGQAFIHELQVWFISLESTRSSSSH